MGVMEAERRKISSKVRPERKMCFAVGYHAHDTLALK